MGAVAPRSSRIERYERSTPVTKASRRDILRPLELVGIAAVIAIFVGAIVLLATREWNLAFIFLGIAFIGALLVLAMLMLAVKPDEFDTGHSENPPRGHDS